ncbi:hypothetical protein S7711_05433 [Stachybotrys chartarum IBT 7711]|uniref:Aminoglycoside phosphotransferase domain-containing protein n=1 Tax=Stachybotrys chartarum (strain CBS 109288 / IBT 7711) TaxID=1280523 RepID=A0A084BAV1_STACB|nr:hypothetical protein S7711_05433 [Stachybotrys chartarum IBT 7711]
MGSSSSKRSRLRTSATQPGSRPHHEPQHEDDEVPAATDFCTPSKDPEAFDDLFPFPFNGKDVLSASEEQLLQVYSTAPQIHRHGGIQITRISKDLVIKGGERVSKSESQNMTFARETLGLAVPKVHRVFTADIPDGFGRTMKAYFIIMDYIPGTTVEDAFACLDRPSKESMVAQVADVIEKMQALTINHLPPGPIGRDLDEKFQGPWFTEDGAGPFPTLQALEDWLNHKIDVCDMVYQLPPGTPKFQFQDMVLTHQDIAPRNLILDRNMNVWFVDWGCAGVYPRGFEQVALREQHWHREFADMVLARLSNQHLKLAEQYEAISYALSTGRHL